MTEVGGISERQDAEKLPFLSRLVQRVVSQTSQGGLERWVYTLLIAVSLMEVLVCLPRACLASTPRRLADKKTKSLGPETLGIMQKEASW